MEFVRDLHKVVTVTKSIKDRDLIIQQQNLDYVKHQSFSRALFKLFRATCLIPLMATQLSIEFSNS